MEIGRQLLPSILCWGSTRAEMPHWSHRCQEGLVPGYISLLQGVSRKRNSTDSRNSSSPSQSSLGKKFLLMLSFNLFSLSQSWNISSTNFTSIKYFKEKRCVDVNMLVKPSHPFLFTNMSGKGRTKHDFLRSVLYGLIHCYTFHLLLPLFLLGSWALGLLKEMGYSRGWVWQLPQDPPSCLNILMPH